MWLVATLFDVVGWKKKWNWIPRIWISALCLTTLDNLLNLFEPQFSLENENVNNAYLIAFGVRGIETMFRHSPITRISANQVLKLNTWKVNNQLFQIKGVSILGEIKNTLDPWTTGLNCAGPLTIFSSVYYSTTPSVAGCILGYGGQTKLYSDFQLHGGSAP